MTETPDFRDLLKEDLAKYLCYTYEPEIPLSTHNWEPKKWEELSERFRERWYDEAERLVKRIERISEELDPR